MKSETSTPKTLKAEFDAARQLIAEKKAKHSALQTEYLAEQQRWEVEINTKQKSLQSQLNYQQSRDISNEIERIKQDIHKLSQRWKATLDSALYEATNAEYALSELKNVVYWREVNSLKSTLKAEQFHRTFAFYRQTFDAGDWVEFLKEIIPHYEYQSVIDAYSDEIDSMIL